MKSFSVAVAALLVLLTRQSSLAFSPTTTQIRLNTLCLYATQKAPAHHEKWQPYFDLFVKYRDAHDGDLSGVMDADGDLGDWLQDQRKQYHLLKQGKKVRLTKREPWPWSVQVPFQQRTTTHGKPSSRRVLMLKQEQALHHKAFDVE